MKTWKRATKRSKVLLQAQDNLPWINWSSFETEATRQLAVTIALLNIDKDPAERLKILLLEQVDPFQELTLQTCEQRVLTEFTLFPNLPLELRNAIWRTCLPRGRPVCLDRLYPILKTTRELKSIGPDYVYRMDRELRREYYIGLPMTLKICHESRAETLLHYIVAHRDVPNPVTGFSKIITLSSASDTRVRRRLSNFLKPLCFDPKRDQIYINHASFWRGEQYAAWIRHLESQLRAPFSLGSIHEIKLVGLRWSKRQEQELKMLVRGIPLTPFWASIFARSKAYTEKRGISYVDGLLCNARLFPGLQRIALFATEIFFLKKAAGPEDMWFDRKDRKRVLSECLRLLRNYLSKQKTSFVKGVMPKLVMYKKGMEIFKRKRRVPGLVFIGDDDMPTVVPGFWDPR